MAKTKVNIDDLFDDDVDATRDFIPTGLKLVDPSLGGGIPLGVLGESFGPTGSGKTSLMYKHIAQQQKLGHVSVLIDAEGSWNPAMGARYGIDTKHVNDKGELTFKMSSKPEMQIVEVLFERLKIMLYNMPGIRFILVDSLAALSPQKATEKKAGEQTNTDALDRARLFSFYMRELRRWINETGDNCTVVFINHEKEVLSMGGYGAPKTDTGGGKALKFYATFRLQHRHVKTDKVKVLDPVTNQEINKEDKLYIRVQAVKNREHPPFQPATFVFDVGGGTGIDDVSTGLAHAVGQKAIKKESGGRYTIPAEWSADGEEVKIHGKPKLVEYFEENREAFERLEDHLAANLSKSDQRFLGEVDEDAEAEGGIIDLNEMA